MVASQKDEKIIEEDFYLSWSRLEVFFAYHERRRPILSLIAKLRERGYDRHLRVGQQVHAFVLSRSLNSGLRREQPRLIMELQTDTRVRMWYYEPPDVKIEMDVEPVELIPEIELLLRRLIDHPVE